MGEAPRIVVTFEGELVLTVGEVWPDGDAPAVVTAEAVAEQMRRTGRKEEVLVDWCLSDGLRVRIDVTQRPSPHHVQDESLFPDIAPPAALESAVEDVWP
jgi:hypothetical protein